MNVITVEVICPATSRNYDYKMPIKMNVGEIKKQVIEDIRIFEGMMSLFENENDVHFYCDEGYINDNLTPEYMGIKNGDRLMLI